MPPTTASCWKSFSPKSARHGPAMAKSLATTVATPAKCVGREAPSMDWLRPPTATVVRTGSGYISSCSGLKSRSTPAPSAFARSPSGSRG